VVPYPGNTSTPFRPVDSLSWARNQKIHCNCGESMKTQVSEVLLPETRSRGQLHKHIVKHIIRQTLSVCC